MANPTCAQGPLPISTHKRMALHTRNVSPSATHVNFHVYTTIARVTLSAVVSLTTPHRLKARPNDEHHSQHALL